MSQPLVRRERILSCILSWIVVQARYADNKPVFILLLLNKRHFCNRVVSPVISHRRCFFAIGFRQPRTTERVDPQLEYALPPPNNLRNELKVMR